MKLNFGGWKDLNKKRLLVLSVTLVVAAAVGFITIKQYSASADTYNILPSGCLGEGENSIIPDWCPTDAPLCIDNNAPAQNETQKIVNQQTTLLRPMGNQLATQFTNLDFPSLDQTTREDIQQALQLIVSGDSCKPDMTDNLCVEVQDNMRGAFYSAINNIARPAFESATRLRPSKPSLADRENSNGSAKNLYPGSTNFEEILLYFEDSLEGKATDKIVFTGKIKSRFYNTATEVVTCKLKGDGGNWNTYINTVYKMEYTMKISPHVTISDSFDGMPTLGWSGGGTLY